MKLNIALEKVYPHPIDKVWAAVTDRDALAAWLMDNDFEPQVGKRFTLRGQAVAGWRGWAECQVLELDPPRRMVWAWWASDEHLETRLVIELEPAGQGTRLTLVHSGDEDEAIGTLLKSGWPGKLEALADRLASA